ncbi:MAG: pyridoxal-phosphate dependent enzyme [Halobacteriaceae archaeon]
MSRRDRGLVCYDCGRRAPADRARCSCGEPLWFPVEPAALALNGHPANLWQYASTLPPADPIGIARTAGGTPLFRAAALDAAAGCRVHIKDETANPTGSFKDRGSAVGVAVAARGTRPVLTVSHGNMARSVAAMAAAAGLECAVLVPADIPPERLGPIARFDPALFRVEGDYGALYDDALDIDGAVALNSDVPLRVAGQKTLAYEIAAALPEADGVVLPVSSGGNASAVWKGFRELARADVIDEPPALYLVQSAACAPIATAFDSGATRPATVDAGETIAYSIANPDPPSGARALAAARETGGAVVAVGDEAIRRARARLSTRAGIAAEAAAATSLAGLQELARRELLQVDDDVVAVMTGTGLLEAPEHGEQPPTITREAVAEAVGEHLGGREA